MCGRLGDGRRECTCDPSQVARYRARVSGPLQDRIDLHVEVPAVPFEELERDGSGESSRTIRDRVVKARQRQILRGQRGPGTEEWNATLGSSEVRRWCRPDPEGRRLLADASDRTGLSARGIHRVLKVARTIADLEDEKHLREPHIAEALQYRGVEGHGRIHP